MPARRILFITYHFPPDAIGSLRVVKFLKYLLRLGWQCAVLTPRTVAYHAQDPSLQREVHGAQVVRTGSLDPYRLLYLWRRLWRKPEQATTRVLKREGARRLISFLRRWLLLPDERVLWVPFAFLRALGRVREFPLILTSSYPHSAQLVGLALKLWYGKKVTWVADFRDGWTQNPAFFDPPTPLHRWLHRLLERWVVRTADLVITVSPPITHYFQTLTRPKKCLTITNGYDEEDFQDLAPVECERFTMVYAGTLYGGRSPLGLFQALKELAEEHEAFRHQAQLVLFTILDERYQRYLPQWGLEKLVRLEGLVPHRQCLQHLMGAHLQLVILGEGEQEKIMVTQKVFEYLRTGRPILVLSPPGECARIVEELNQGQRVSPSAVAAIKTALIGYFEQWKAGQLAPSFNPEVQRYSREQLTGTLAEQLTGLMKE